MTPEASVPDKPAGLESELFRLLFESADIAKFAQKDKQRYINDMTTAQDIKNQIAYARTQGEEKGMEKGIQKGMQEGIEKGMEKERLTIASNLKAAKFPIESICQATGLSREQVEAL